MTAGKDAITVTGVGGEAAELLAAIHGRCFAHAWDAAAIARMISMPGTVALIAHGPAGPHTNVFGCAVARIAFEQCEILTLGVLPEARRRGGGGALVDRICRLAAATGANVVLLEVAEDNDAAQALYRVKSFTTAGRRPDYYRDNGLTRDAIVMRRDLGSGMADA